MQYLNRALSALAVLTLAAACGEIAGPGADPIEVDAAGASSLALGSAGSLAETDVTLIGTDDEVIIVTPEGGGAAADLSGGTVEVDADGAVAVEIEAPRTLGYAIFLNNHNATVIDVEAPGAIQVNDGDVSVSGATEELAVQVNNGDVELAFATADLPDVGVQVNDGDIELTVPADANADLAITAASITFVGLDFDGINIAGTATGSLGLGGGSVAIQTAGTVTVRGE